MPLLVDVEALEGRRGVLPERRAPGARVVAPLRPLDLEHVGPEHRQDVAGIGAGDVVGEFHDLHAGQGQHGRSSEMGLRLWCSGCPTLSPFRGLRRARPGRRGQQARPLSVTRECQWTKAKPRLARERLLGRVCRRRRDALALLAVVPDIEPAASHALLPHRRRSGRRLRLPPFAHRSNRSHDFLGSGVMHHVADPRHVAKRARVEFAVQSRGVLVGLDNAIIRAGNQANRNIQLPVELAEGPGSIHQHLRFFGDGFDLRRAQSMRDRIVSLESLGNRARCEDAPDGIRCHQMPGEKQSRAPEYIVDDGKPEWRKCVRARALHGIIEPRQKHQSCHLLGVLQRQRQGHQRSPGMANDDWLLDPQQGECPQEELGLLERAPTFDPVDARYSRTLDGRRQ